MFLFDDLFGDIFSPSYPPVDQQQDDRIMEQLRQRYLQHQAQGQRAMSQKEIDAYIVMRQTQELPDKKVEEK